MLTLLGVLVAAGAADLAVFVISWWWSSRCAMQLYREGRVLRRRMSLIEIARRWKVSMAEAWRRV